MIGILDYGLGNIQAFLNIYKLLSIDVVKINSPEQFNNVDKIILPGVGSFDWAIEKLYASGLMDGLQKAVIGERKYILGVCVGMQIMATNSEEGCKEGLNWIEGKVIKFKPNKIKFNPLPHIGWNNVLMNNNILSKGKHNLLITCKDAPIPLLRKATKLILQRKNITDRCMGRNAASFALFLKKFI